MPSGYGAFSVFLVGLRIAEVGEHAITSMIGTHDLSHVLGVEPSRERCRTHKVAEQDGELAAFSRSSLRTLR